MKYRVYLMPGHRESDPATAAVDQLVGKQATLDIDCDMIGENSNSLSFYGSTGTVIATVPHHAYWFCEQVKALEVENVAVPTECVHRVPVGAFCQDCFNSFNDPINRIMNKLSGTSDVD